MTFTASTVFQGLRTALYIADDLDHARAWYSGLLGYGPYFDESFSG